MEEKRTLHNMRKPLINLIVDYLEQEEKVTLKENLGNLCFFKVLLYNIKHNIINIGTYIKIFI